MSQADKNEVKQVTNVERRTWDKEVYEKKAKERLERGEDYDETSRDAQEKKNLEKEEFQHAPDGAAGPAGSKRAFLRARSSKLDLDSKLNKTQVITASSSGSNQGGYWCEVCKCLLKDSIAYLDHINGKKHQRTLGFSMRVEKSTVDSVRGKLDKLKKDVEEKQKQKGTTRKSAVQEYEERLAEYAMIEEKNRQERKEAKAKKAAEDVEEVDEEAAAVAAMMGFHSFAGGKR